MREGFYSMYYTGKAGSGFGVVVMENGVIVGADASGGTYDGEYASADDHSPLTGIVHLQIPHGVELVTGFVAQGGDKMTMSFPLNLPSGFADNNQYTTLQTETGPVNVILKKLRDLKAKQ